MVGASRGIGLAIARGMAEAGARTILAARSMHALNSEAEALRSRGLLAEALEMDVSDMESVRAVAEQLPAVDILANIAGMNIRKPFENFTAAEYDLLLRTNLEGLVWLTQKVGSAMIARKSGGKIIFIGSLTSVLGLPYVSIYGITKSALAGLTRLLAAEWGRHDIQVNCIAPGMILTDLNRAVWERPEMHAWLTGAQSLPRMGRPEDLAPLAVFLSGPGSDYITGQTIAVDGGFTTTARWPFEPA